MEDSIKSFQPNDYTQYPESSIRKYRAPLNGPRTSQSFNLIQQQIVSDLGYIHDQLEASEQNKILVYSLIDIQSLGDI